MVSTTQRLFPDEVEFGTALQLLMHPAREEDAVQTHSILLALDPFARMRSPSPKVLLPDDKQPASRC